MTTDEPLTAAGATPPQPRYRLFFALLPDEATRARIHQAAVQLQAQHAPRGRWIDPGRYHLTLQFLGSYRVAILALVVFFIIGGILLSRVDMKKGIADVETGGRLAA